MKRSGSVLLSGLIGAVLASTWSRLSLFSDGLKVHLLFTLLLALQTLVLYVFLRAQPVAWSLVAAVVAMLLAIPGSIAAIDPGLLSSRVFWTDEVPFSLWELRWYVAAFLMAPVSVSLLVRHVRSDNRWRGP